MYKVEQYQILAIRPPPGPLTELFPYTSRMKIHTLKGT